MTMIFKAFAGALAVLQNPTVGPTGPLTLDQAASIAERNAFSVQLQLSRVEQGVQNVVLNRASLLPTGSASYSLSHLPQDVVTNLGGAQIVQQRQDTRTISGSLSFPIDLFGNSQRRVQAAQAGTRAARVTLEATRNDARLNAKSAFIAVLRAQAALKVADQTVLDATQQLERERQLFAGQQVARIDVVRLEAQLESARADQLVAQNTLANAKNALNFALARPIETPIEAVDVTALPSDPPAVQSLTQAAETKRPELRSWVETLKQLEYTRRAAESGQLPSLSLGVNYSRNLDAGAFAQKEQTTANVTLSLPVFDGGATRARVKSARQDELQAKINLAQTRLTITQDVTNAYTSILTAKARLASAEAQVRAAEEVYRIAQVRQAAGSDNTYVEVVDALTSLVQARNTLISARYDYLLAYSQLQRAVGSDDLSAATGTGAASPVGGGSR